MLPVTQKAEAPPERNLASTDALNTAIHCTGSQSKREHMPDSVDHVSPTFGRASKAHHSSECQTMSSPVSALSRDDTLSPCHLDTPPAENKARVASQTAMLPRPRGHELCRSDGARAAVAAHGSTMWRPCQRGCQGIRRRLCPLCSVPTEDLVVRFQTHTPRGLEDTSRCLSAHALPVRAHALPVHAHALYPPSPPS